VKKPRRDQSAASSATATANQAGSADWRRPGGNTAQDRHDSAIGTSISAPRSGLSGRNARCRVRCGPLSSRLRRHRPGAGALRARSARGSIDLGRASRRSLEGRVGAGRRAPHRAWLDRDVWSLRSSVLEGPGAVRAVRARRKEDHWTRSRLGNGAGEREPEQLEKRSGWSKDANTRHHRAAAASRAGAITPCGPRRSCRAARAIGRDPGDEEHLVAIESPTRSRKEHGRGVDRLAERRASRRATRLEHRCVTPSDATRRGRFIAAPWSGSDSGEYDQEQQRGRRRRSMNTVACWRGRTESRFRSRCCAEVTSHGWLLDRQDHASRAGLTRLAVCSLSGRGCGVDGDRASRVWLSWAGATAATPGVCARRHSARECAGLPGSGGTASSSVR